MKYLNKVCLLIVVLLLIVTAAACASAAEAKKAVYENGDIITVVTPYSPGGSGDRAFRLVTPYLTKEIEAMTGAKVDFIVESVPGGGGVIGNTQIYKARPDGKTLGIIGLGAAPFLQLLQGGYDVEKYTYIAQLINSPAVLVVAGNSELNSFDELIKRSQTKPFLTGTGGIGAFEHISSLLTQSILKESGVEFKQDFVHYRGTSDIILAIQKGEVEGSLMSASNTINPVRNGDLKVLAVYSAERDDVFARGVPSLIEQKVPGAEKMLAAIRQDRTLVGPPGMPQDVAEVLQKALWKALNDKQFIEDAKKANLPVNISEAATAAQYASDALKIAKENEQMLKGAMEF